jgi:hypothetical protein
MNKIITLLACTILIVSCNSDKEIVDGLSNRILKINTLIHSQNKGTYYLNVLDDSINIIKFDISTAKINDENKVIVSKLLDSISNNILIARLMNCIIGKKFSISSEQRGNTKMFDDAPNAPSGTENLIDLLKRSYTSTITTLTVYIKNVNECEIIKSENSLMNQFAGILPTKREGGTYKYIGNNTFEISNGFILKVTDVQNCKSELSIKILTEEEIKKNIIGNSIKISNLEVAQNDFSKKMKWDDAKKASEALGEGWRLPTIDELVVMYQNKDKIGGFSKNYYWSSTDYNEEDGKYNRTHSWIGLFDIGKVAGDNRNYPNYVRAVRTL